jgi:xanthine dehydrogenase accessory factor
VSNIYDDIQSALNRGEQVAVVTITRTTGSSPRPPGTKLLAHADGRMLGTLGGPLLDARALQDALETLKDGNPRTTRYTIEADTGETAGSCGGTMEVFVEIVRPEQRLILVGGGYVAQALARFASHLDFRILVIDDRRDLVNPQTFPEGAQLHFGDIPQMVSELHPDSATWIVVVTRGHHLDKEALRVALQSPAPYVGMIGSPGKVRRIFRELLQEGIPRERLEQAHAPIGLDLGAETPGEIALAIAAELLLLRRGGTGRPLHQVHRMLEEVQVSED